MAGARKFSLKFWKKKKSKPEDSSLRPFESLSQEIIYYIFSFLSIKDLCTLSLVCSIFRNIANDDKLWKNFLTAGEINSLESEKGNNKYKTFFLETTKGLLVELREFEAASKESFIESLLTQKKPLIKFLRNKKNKLSPDDFFDILGNVFTKTYHPKSIVIKDRVHTFRLHELLILLKEFRNLEHKIQSFDRQKIVFAREKTFSILKERQASAAIILPGCYEKLTEFLRSDPTPLQVEHLWQTLGNFVLVDDPHLPDLLEPLINIIRKGDYYRNDFSTDSNVLTDRIITEALSQFKREKSGS